MSENFNAGDVVCLKSGGPAMTVSGTVGDGRIMCVWFNEQEEEKSSYFFPPVLEVVKDN